MWAPLYDPLVRRIGRGRRRSIELARLGEGDRVLIPGAGTGLDLELLEPGLRITALEQSPAMLRRLQQKASARELQVHIVRGDALRLPFTAGSFDGVLLHLIVAVVSDPVQMLAEARRVLAPRGRILVFDKFAADHQKPSVPRRMLNVAARAVATDITVRLGEAASAAGLSVIHREGVSLGGVFQVAVLEVATET